MKALEVFGMSLGLTLAARDEKLGHQLHDAQLLEKKPAARTQLISLMDLPHLRTAVVCHSRDKDAKLTPAEVFDLDERNWRHIEPQMIAGKETQVAEQLAWVFGALRTTSAPC